jgi:DNA-binding response OmpR family regulator
MHVSDLKLESDDAVHRGRRAIKLSPAEVTVLKTLMRTPGKVLTLADLRESVWRQEEDYYKEFVAFVIKRLRRKLGEPRLVHTTRDGKLVTLAVPGRTRQRPRARLRANS